MAEQEALRTRLALLAAPGGAGAGARWLARALFRVDAYRVLAKRLAADEPAATGAWSAAQFCTITQENIADRDAAMIRHLDAHNGCACAITTSHGGRIYALQANGSVACQARVEFGEMRTDTPLPMTVVVGPANAFLSYLHTSPAHRRTGAARALLALVARHLAGEGRWTHCVAHVQSTNVRSLNAFRSAGWQPIASIWTVGNRLLHVSRGPLARALPLAVEPLARGGVR